MDLEAAKAVWTPWAETSTARKTAFGTTVLAMLAGAAGVRPNGEAVGGARRRRSDPGGRAASKVGPKIASSKCR